MHEVDYLLLSLKTDREASLGASPLSLYVSSQYQKKFGSADTALSGGSYPLVQYKVIRGSPIVVAINEGCELLWQIYDKLDEISERSPYKIMEKRVNERKAAFGPVSGRLKYRFLTPWLTIVEDEFNKLDSQTTQKGKILASILENNFHTLARNFKLPMEDGLSLSLNVKDGQIIQKDTNLVGFFGTFFVNFELPQFLGLGKGVGRGFGTTKQ